VSEFTKYLSVGIILLAASLVAGRIRILLLALPLLVLSLFLSSARGPVVVCTGVIALLCSMRGRSKSGWIVRVVLASACLLGGLFWSVSEVNELDVSQELHYIVKHQTEGLLNPLDEKKSTASGHGAAFVGGFVGGLSNPLGKGLGLATHVAGAFGAQG